ncbi:MAG: heme NO-binding domain-containing protein [Actinomycetota bacterium]
MKGVIFNVLEAFVIEHHGEDALDDIIDATDLQTTEPFVGPGNYPAEDLLALVGTASTMTGVAVPDLIRQYGRFAFAFLADSVPTLMERFDGAGDFLLGLESVIHTEVRKLDPNASPARFTTIQVSDDELDMYYESPFGLFTLVEGLLDGVGDWYSTPLTCEMIESEGTNARFRIRFADAALAPASTDAVAADV